MCACHVCLPCVLAMCACHVCLPCVLAMCACHVCLPEVGRFVLSVPAANNLVTSCANEQTNKGTARRDTCEQRAPESELDIYRDMAGAHPTPRARARRHRTARAVASPLAALWPCHRLRRRRLLAIATCNG